MGTPARALSTLAGFGAGGAEQPERGSVQADVAKAAGEGNGAPRAMVGTSSSG